MIGLEVNDGVVLEQQKVLEQCLSTNPKTQKALQKLIKQVIMQARARVVKNIHFDNGDPRGSAQAVRTAVYKKILGANINIYNSRKAHGSVNYSPQRTLRPGQRGGNRQKRSPRTIKMQSYPPLDRGFILRFVNSGTSPRFIGFRNGTRSNAARYQALADKIGTMEHQGTGHRGAIAPRNFFRGAGEPALVQATERLANLIDEELEKMLSKKK